MIGIDIEETDRFKKEITNTDFLNLIFSKEELNYCFSKKEPHISLTGTFCAKEAIIKATSSKTPIKDIQIVRVEGRPIVKIKGKTNKKIKVSISHTKKYATAVAVKQ